MGNRYQEILMNVNRTFPPRMGELSSELPPPNYKLTWVVGSLCAFITSAAFVVLVLFVAPTPPGDLNLYQLVSYSPEHFLALVMLVLSVFIMLWTALRRNRHEVRFLNAYCDKLESFSSEQLREWEVQLYAEMESDVGGFESKEIAAIWMVLDRRGDPTATGESSVKTAPDH